MPQRDPSRLRHTAVAAILSFSGLHESPLLSISMTFRTLAGFVQICFASSSLDTVLRL